MVREPEPVGVTHEWREERGSSLRKFADLLPRVVVHKNGFKTFGSMVMRIGLKV